jgi:hypothetical protein
MKTCAWIIDLPGMHGLVAIFEKKTTTPHSTLCHTNDMQSDLKAPQTHPGLLELTHNTP